MPAGTISASQDTPFKDSVSSMFVWGIILLSSLYFFLYLLRERDNYVPIFAHFNSKFCFIYNFLYYYKWEKKLNSHLCQQKSTVAIS